MSEAAGGARLTRAQRITAVLVAIGTLIGALAGAAALFDWFEQRANPAEAAPPTTIDARIADVTLRSTNERLIDYLMGTNQETSGVDEFQGAERGYVFLVRVRLQGHQDQRLPLRWALIDARTDAPLSDPIYTQTAVEFEPRGPDQARTWQIWVPYAPRSGTYRLRATLLDARRQPLDERTSDPFAQAAAPEP